MKDGGGGDAEGCEGLRRRDEEWDDGQN